MEIAAASAAMYERDASAATFGIELIEATPSRAVVRMHVRPDLCNGLDVIHGGMTFLLADSAMAFASNAGGGPAFATSAEIDWLAPARAGQWLTATATVAHTARRSAIWNVEVRCGDAPDDPGEPVALFHGRTRIVDR